MDFGAAMEMGRDAFWTGLLASAPILVIGLVVGVLISLFQAVTQLQEQTLTFVPKIVAMFLAATLFMAWIAELMISYTQRMLSTPPY